LTFSPFLDPSGMLGRDVRVFNLRQVLNALRNGLRIARSTAPYEG